MAEMGADAEGWIATHPAGFAYVTLTGQRHHAAAVTDPFLGWDRRSSAHDRAVLRADQRSRTGGSAMIGADDRRRRDWRQPTPWLCGLRASRRHPTLDHARQRPLRSSRSYMGSSGLPVLTAAITEFAMSYAATRPSATTELFLEAMKVRPDRRGVTVMRRGAVPCKPRCCWMRAASAGVTVATAESCTGGLIAAALTA